MSTLTIDSVASRTAPVRPRSSVRLTRRGKAVVFVLTLVALLAVAVIGANISGAAAHKGQISTHAVTVRPGDTLWDLASSASHGGDVRAMEQRIQDLNGLSTSTLYVGQHLIIPN